MVAIPESAGGNGIGNAVCEHLVVVGIQLIEPGPKVHAKGLCKSDTQPQVIHPNHLQQFL